MLNLSPLTLEMEARGVISLVAGNATTAAANETIERSFMIQFPRARSRQL